MVEPTETEEWYRKKLLAARAQVAQDDERKKVSKTLLKRELTHGDYEDTASVATSLQELLRGALCTTYEARPGTFTDKDLEIAWHTLTMITTKLSRAVNGDIMTAEHWHDIAGYATLMETYINRRNRVEEAPDPEPGALESDDEYLVDTRKSMYGD